MLEPQALRVMVEAPRVDLALERPDDRWAVTVRTQLAQEALAR